MQMTSPKTQAPLALILALALAPAIPARAQTASAPIIPPAPLVAPNATPAPPGPAIARELDARRALDLGLPTIAAQIYQQLLDTTVTTSTPVARNRIILALATALIQDNRDDEASKILQQFIGAPTPAVQLRQAMIDARAPAADANAPARLAAARATVAALRPETLPPEDKSWLLFLRGLLAERARDYAASGPLYQQASTAAISDIQRAWFTLALQRARLHLGEATQATIDSLNKTLTANLGRTQGYLAVSQLAIAYNTLGRPAEAIALLQTQLQLLAPQETTRRDEWRLLLGMIAGPESDAGRAALRDLITDSPDRDKQRAALRLLAAAALKPDRPTGLTDYRALLDQLIAATPPHPILGSLLLFRAQLALTETPIPNYLSAENDANRYLTEFPNAMQRPNAYGILTAIAWKNARYRAAASQATAFRDALLNDTPENRNTRAQLNLLIAEAYFRAKDYRNASNAYGYALTHPLPAGVYPGLLMFQHVLSEMQAGDPATALPAAQKLLDQYAADTRFDPESRWQAEWNLASALQSDGQTLQAYDRVNRLLDNTPTPAALPADLRTRMAWLQARLAYDNGDYARTMTLVEKLLPTLGDTDPERDLKAKLLLLEAQATLALNPADPAAATDIFKKLRADYPKTESSTAIYSYIVEADAAAKRGQLVQAQGLLKKLAEDYKTDTTYAPYALYQAALYAERRGTQQQYYREAYNLLEALVTKYPNSDLYFSARLRQGNLLRLLGEPSDYGLALRLYTELVGKYTFPQFPDALLAELAQADTYHALATTDASRAESAATIYERLLDLDRPDVPLGLRVEAGHKLGLILLERGDTARLETIWWQMIRQFLLVDTQAEKLGMRGRYWMSRTLLKLGEVMEQQNKIDQAREVYDLLISKDLPGVTLAKARLAGAAGK